MTGWTSFEKERPADFHGYLLVTNNLTAVNRYGRATHVWIVSMVHYHDDGPNVFGGQVLAEAGEITAFAHPSDTPLRNLTHWRYALSEEAPTRPAAIAEGPPSDRWQWSYRDYDGALRCLGNLVQQTNAITDALREWEDERGELLAQIERLKESERTAMAAFREMQREAHAYRKGASIREVEGKKEDDDMGGSV